MSRLEDEITLVTGPVSDLIRNDSFPEHVRPEELRSAVRAYPMLGGKRIRPALLLWSCGLFGGNLESATPAAAAVEIFHNWTLVHDDIIDRDRFRRGHPTTHMELCHYAESAFGCKNDAAEKFGSDMAILAGDVQQAWAVDMLLRLTDRGVNPELVLKLARRMTATLYRDLLSGEAQDVEAPLKGAANVSENAILRIISGKTAALFVYSVQCGAAIALNRADFDSFELKKIAAFAENLGMAYQLQDDLLGLYGEINTFGKPLCSDFQEAKPTLLYREALKRLPKEKAAALEAMTGLPFYSTEMITHIRNLVTECGAEEIVRERANTYSNATLEALSELPDNKYRNLLSMLVNNLLNRKA